MVGQIGISQDEFWNQNPRESSIIYCDWIEKQKQFNKLEWDRTRWQTTQLINIHLKEEDRMTPDRMFPMKKGEVEEENLPTPEQMEYWGKKFDKKPAKVTTYN